MSGYTIARADLVAMIESASEGCAERNRLKLRRVATVAERLAVGWFHCDGAECPARQARYAHQGFQERFDRAMCARFGLDFDSVTAFPHHQPFTVSVVDHA